MLICTIILTFTALLVFGFGMAINKGHTGLIHDYHQKNIPPSELPAYGKDFSVGMFTMSASLLLSGIILLLGESKPVVYSSVTVMTAGLIVSFVILTKVQKKYNGGVF